MRVFKTGDKVRFISTKGSGVVTTVHKGIVNVLIEDGFEIPVETSDIVVIEPMTDKKNPFTRKDEFTHLEPRKEEKKTVFEPEKKQPATTTVAPEKGLYLAFIPENQETLISGNLDVYLINFTHWQVAFHFLQADSRKGYCGLKTGFMQKGDATLIGSVSHNGIREWSRLRIQLLCFDEKESQLFDSEIIDIELKPSKFIKEDIYSENPFFDERAHVLFVHDLSHPPLAGQKNEMEIRVPEKSTKMLIDRFMVDLKSAEVDLHIEKLRGDHKTMKKEDMMLVQLAFFRQCLESAIEKNIEKMVFIHGVGAGLLKKELQDILKLYSNLEHEDASIMKYGIGATEVRIKH